MSRAYRSLVVASCTAWLAACGGLASDPPAVPSAAPRCAAVGRPLLHLSGRIVALGVAPGWVYASITTPTGMELWVTPSTGGTPQRVDHTLQGSDSLGPWTARFEGAFTVDGAHAYLTYLSHEGRGLSSPRAIESVPHGSVVGTSLDLAHDPPELDPTHRVVAPTELSAPLGRDGFVWWTLDDFNRAAYWDPLTRRSTWLGTTELGLADAENLHAIDASSTVVTAKLDGSAVDRVVSAPELSALKLAAIDTTYEYATTFVVAPVKERVLYRAPKGTGDFRRIGSGPYVTVPSFAAAGGVLWATTLDGVGVYSEKAATTLCTGAVDALATHDGELFVALGGDVRALQP